MSAARPTGDNASTAGGKALEAASCRGSGGGVGKRAGGGGYFVWIKVLAVV